MITQLNNELSSMTELNRRTEERNRHLEEKVIMLNEQLSGVQNTLNELIRSQQALVLDHAHPLLHALNSSAAPLMLMLLLLLLSPSVKMMMMVMVMVMVMVMTMGMIRTLLTTISTIRTSNIRQISYYVMYIGCNGLGLCVLRSSGFLNSLHL